MTYEKTDLQSATIDVSGDYGEAEAAAKRCLEGVEGIESVRPGDNGIVVEYHPYRMTVEAIRNRLSTAGITMTVATKGKRNAFQRMIDRMAAENNKVLGNGRLDCCDLNKANRA